MTMISFPSTSTRSSLGTDIVGRFGKKARRPTSEPVDLITRPRPFFLVDARRINECGRAHCLVPLDDLSGRASFVPRAALQSETSRLFPLMPVLQFLEDHHTCQPSTQSPL